MTENVVGREHADLEQQMIEAYRANLEEQLANNPDMTVLYALVKADFDKVALERMGRFLSMEEAQEASTYLHIDWETAVANAIDLLE